MKSDKVIGFILIVFSSVMYFLASRLPKGTFGTGGADFFPKIIFILLGLMSILLIAGAVVRERKRGGEPSAAKTKPLDPTAWAKVSNTLRYHKTVLVSFGVFLGYVVLMYYFGYPVATLAFMLVLMWFLGPRDKKSIGVIAATTIVVTFGLYYFFLKFLKIFLPTGTLL